MRSKGVFQEFNFQPRFLISFSPRANFKIFTRLDTATGGSVDALGITRFSDNGDPVFFRVGDKQCHVVPASIAHAPLQQVKLGAIHPVLGANKRGYAVLAFDLIQDFLRDVHNGKRNLG